VHEIRQVTADEWNVRHYAKPLYLDQQINWWVIYYRSLKSTTLETYIPNSLISKNYSIRIHWDTLLQNLCKMFKDGFFFIIWKYLVGEGEPGLHLYATSGSIKMLSSRWLVTSTLRAVSQHFCSYRACGVPRGLDPRSLPKDALLTYATSYSTLLAWVSGSLLDWFQSVLMSLARRSEHVTDPTSPWPSLV